MKDSAIGWCHDTINFWWGCTEKRYDDGTTMRPECAPCYARELDARYGKSFDGHRHWGEAAPRWVRTEAALKEFWKSERLASKTGRRRLFINSMSDFFEDRSEPDWQKALDEARYQALDAFRKARYVDILLLTKRPADVRKICDRLYLLAIEKQEDEALDFAVWLHEWMYEKKAPAHIWVGSTMGTQRAADEEMPRLCAVPAAVRFVSVEPMWNYVDLVGPFDGLCAFPLGTFIHWVIAGGQSGTKRRELDIFALARLAEVCWAYEVPLFVKQDSGLLPGQQGRIPEALWARKEFPKAA